MGVEHHAHPHATLAGTEERLLDLLALKLELLEQQLLTGSVDQLHHRGATVIGHHEQTLLTADGGNHEQWMNVAPF